MNFVRRLLLCLYGLSSVVLGVFLVACMADTQILLSAIYYIQNVFTGGYAFVLTFLKAAFLIILGSVSVFLAVHRKATPSLAKINSCENGQVNISLNAIETLVQKTALSVDGIKEVKSKLKTTPEGVAIYLYITVPDNINIPVIASDLQNQVKENLQNMSGLNVLEVKVLVNNIASVEGAKTN
ncbi:MAG: alkaline shock response membrane anchor protein AmaP [Clostridiales bacterium]